MAKSKKNNFLKNLTTLLISSIFSLLILELGVRIFVPQDKKITWIEMHERGFVMNQSGGYAFQEFDSLKAEYRFTNNRTRGAEPETTDSNQIDILTIGDSFTFGLILQEEDTYVNHLQNWADSSFSTKIQFHNAAVGGAGLADWPAWLEVYGDSIKPEIVIYFIHNHDVFRALSKNLYVLIDDNERTLADSQRWRVRPFFMDLSKKSWYRWLQANSDLMNVVVKLFWRFIYFEDVSNNFTQETEENPIPSDEDFSIESDYSLNLALALIQNMENWCEENECELLLTNTGYFEPEMSDAHTLRFHEFLKQSPDYDYLDLHPCVSSGVNGDFSTIQIPNDTHPNPKGARLISNCLIEQLRFVLDYN